MKPLYEPTFSPMTRVLAIALAAVAFPVIWVGSLVTTYNAGMAVPDWPGTYGYNLFLYPWTTWIVGPWDLFVEHGHRLLASLAGMVAIALAIVSWRNGSRRWLAWLCLAALGLVVFQGVLGGVRVLFDKRLVAMIHGTVGPAFFAYSVFVAAVAARSWSRAVWRPLREAEDASGKVVLAKESTPAMSRGALLFAIGLAALALTQIGLGAGVRHLSALATRELFVGLVVAHLVAAGLLWFFSGAGFVAAIAWRTNRAPIGWASFAFLLVTVQIALGGGTWIVNYSLPDVESLAPWLAPYVIEQEGLLQSYVVTAHVMVGSLILATTAILIAHEWKPAFLPAGVGSYDDETERREKKGDRLAGASSRTSVRAAFPKSTASASIVASAFTLSENSARRRANA